MVDVSLGLYYLNAPTYLYTDASGVGISAVLSQEQGGQEVMVACASHMLQPAECNYSMVELEALACALGGGWRSLNATCGGATLPSLLTTALYHFSFRAPPKQSTPAAAANLCGGPFCL